MTGRGEEASPELLRKVAGKFREHGRTAEWLREQAELMAIADGPNREADERFFLAIAGELDALEARDRFRVIGGDPQ